MNTNIGRPATQRKGLTAVGRLTLWFGSLFLLMGSATGIGSYVLVSRAFPAGEDQRRVFNDLGLNQPSPEAMQQLSNALGGDPAEILLAATASGRRQVINDLALRSAVSLAITLVFALFGAWWLARRSLKPVRRLTTLAQGMSASKLHDRIDLVGPDDELKGLADTFDDMLDRLEQAFSAQRLFAASVSHELRTPLSVMRGEADLVAGNPASSSDARRLAGSVQSMVQRADRLVGSLLSLSRAESGMASGAPCDLADITGDVVADMADEASQAEVSVELELNDAPIRGDVVLLRSLVENVIRNAINYNRRNGEIVVTVETSPGHAVLQVENTGRELSTGEIERMRAPFVRGEREQTSVPGSGIGTAVITAVVSAHDGNWTIFARPGGGVIARVEIPLR
jgi:signal transduction histidine kinase